MSVTLIIAKYERYDYLKLHSSEIFTIHNQKANPHTERITKKSINSSTWKVIAYDYLKLPLFPLEIFHRIMNDDNSDKNGEGNN